MQKYSIYTYTSTHQHTVTLYTRAHTHTTRLIQQGSCSSCCLSKYFISQIPSSSLLYPTVLLPAVSLQILQLTSFSKNMKHHFTPRKKKSVPSTVIDLEVMCAAGHYCPQSLLIPIFSDELKSVCFPLWPLSRALCHPPLALRPLCQKADLDPRVLS